MKINDLKPASGAKKNTKRLGRGPGSGLGKTSGRGHKGAGQRSGNKKRTWFEGGQMSLQRRLPKRGFSNHLFRKEYQIVNLSDLNKLEEKTIDSTVLYNHGLVRSALRPVKILGNGELDHAIIVEANAFSVGAKNKIEQQGGSANVL
ncbi:MAG: 50S ribosomal protein L15 [Fidelibacterota bacterium]